MDIEIRSLDRGMVDDFLRFFEVIAFTEHQEWGRECYCCFFHAASRQQWTDRTGDDNREEARQMILDGRMKGLLAYADGVPAGWCHFDRKDSLPGLRVFYPKVFEDGEEQAIGSIVCFTVAQGYRGLGIASRLLAGACRELAAMGCAAAEAYPMLADGTDEEDYHGRLAMYQSQGFTISRKSGKQAVVRKTLSP